MKTFLQKLNSKAELQSLRIFGSAIIIAQKNKEALVVKMKSGILQM